MSSRMHARDLVVEPGKNKRQMKDFSFSFEMTRLVDYDRNEETMGSYLHN